MYTYFRAIIGYLFTGDYTVSKLLIYLPNARKSFSLWRQTRGGCARIEKCGQNSRRVQFRNKIPKLPYPVQLVLAISNFSLKLKSTEHLLLFHMTSCLAETLRNRLIYFRHYRRTAVERGQLSLFNRYHPGNHLSKLCLIIP